MLRETIINHYNRYPQMQVQDYIKMIFQNNFGSDHLCVNPDIVHDMLTKEWKRISPEDSELFTDIGNGFCRINLAPAKYKNIHPELIEKIFFFSSNGQTKNMEHFYIDISELKSLCNENLIPVKAQEIDNFIIEWENNGRKAVSHSSIFRENYNPSYRIAKYKYAQFIPLINEIYDTTENVVIAIDGRCASGKSTLSDILKEFFECNIIHADDFFLPLEKRTTKRYSEAGGNFDYERFNDEVINGIKSGKAFSYRKFVCSKKDFDGEINIIPKRVTIIEGSYCMNPHIEDIYNIKVFVTTSYDEQLSRIEKRNGIKFLEDFKTKWIPYEEKYFDTYKISDKCDFIFET